MRIKHIFLLLISSIISNLNGQDLTLGLIANDLTDYKMQDVPKPKYLQSFIDPTFGTTIRRISNAGEGGVVKPMYSTIQAWNSDESYMILYDQTNGVHQLIDGMNYSFIRNMNNVKPDDIEQLFWDFNDPLFLYYVDKSTSDLIKYQVETRDKQILVNLREKSNCNGNISLGNDVQMMSWDSDCIGFRCDNTEAFMYRISTDKITKIQTEDVAFFAPMPTPSGMFSYHNGGIYNTTSGILSESINEKKTEHSCLGRLGDGKDGHFAIAFAEGPDGGCIGDIIAHKVTTGKCFPVISQSQGYNYPQSGTHISALAHKNAQSGWLAASMIGYDQDGNSLLDQELIIARAIEGNVKVYRIGHHRSDEDEFDYWGEPHVTISPTGTRVLFGSDWSGVDDGKSVDSYVVELPAFQQSLGIAYNTIEGPNFSLFPHPLVNTSIIEFENTLRQKHTLYLYDIHGREVWKTSSVNENKFILKRNSLPSGIYIFKIQKEGKIIAASKIIVK